MSENDKYGDIMTDHFFLLIANGYDDRTLKVPLDHPPLLSKLEDGFKKAVLNALRSKKPESFFLETKGLVGDQKDLFYFKFHYQYDPSKIELNIPALYAVMGTTENVYLLSRNSDLPDTEYVQKDLNERKLQPAINILNKIKEKRIQPTQRKKL